MHIIGLTGGIGSGKTTVANLFGELGATIIDTDQLSRELTQVGQPALQEIVQRFGPEIELENGELNRTALRKIIFSNLLEKKWLENLLHPLIRFEMVKLIKQSTSAYCMVVIPLLFESELNPIIQRTLVVDAPLELQIERTVHRDKCTIDETQKIIASQLSREQRLQKADDIIFNTGSLDDLKQQVTKLDRFYRNL